MAKCWEFQLLDVTEIVQEVEVGTSVTGAAGPGEVEVFCAEGPLGRAPQAVARAMVEHLQANPSLRFAGNVTNIKARKAGPVVSVRLCLQ